MYHCLLLIFEFQKVRLVRIIIMNNETINPWCGYHWMSRIELFDPFKNLHKNFCLHNKETHFQIYIYIEFYTITLISYQIVL